MTFTFESYNDFMDNEYEKYPSHECPICSAFVGISEETTTIVLGKYTLRFEPLQILRCSSCDFVCLPCYSKQQVKNGYDDLISKEIQSDTYVKKPENSGSFPLYRRLELLYDYQEYYNTPGLCTPLSHKGFLTPVYFNYKVLIPFLGDYDYKCNIFSESYGRLIFNNPEEDWSIPFGIDENRNIIFWLGDLAKVDERSLSLLRVDNIRSDYKLISTEFYQAQLMNIWSEPNREIKICILKDQLYKSIQEKYAVSLFHLEAECLDKRKQYVKPIRIREPELKSMVEFLDKILNEGISITNLKILYHQLEPQPDKQYDTWASIKLLEATLLKAKIRDNQERRSLLTPLHVLHNLRNVYSHAFSAEKEQHEKEIAAKNLGVSSGDFEGMYDHLLDRLIVLYEKLINIYGG